MLPSRSSIPRRISRTLLLCVAAAMCHGALAQSAEPAPSAKRVEQVNINQADAATIADVLQGVGQSKARAIVEYREQYGPFESLDELVEVKGIGEATLNLNRERILLE
jgi:competence protein ComEA